MSTSYLRIIATDPLWTPDPDAAEAARQMLAELVPRSRAVTAGDWGTVEFVDPGENFGEILCPACGSRLDLRWWQDRMDAAYDREKGFGALDVVTPCCGCSSNLNDLAYTWACGFARFQLEAKDYDQEPLDAGELARLAAVLGCDVRQILAHY